MKKFTIALLAAGAFVACSSDLSAQVPVKVSPQDASYEQAKTEWISNNKAAYESMQSESAPKAQTRPASTKAAAQGSDAQKETWIEQNPDLYKAQVQELHQRKQNQTVRKVPRAVSVNQGPVPVPANSRTGFDYDEAKARWVKENPKAYHQLNQPKGQK